MDDKTLQALTDLANKLGTTADYLWGVLLKQAPLTGAINLVLMAAWVIFAVIWYRMVVRKTSRPKATEDDRYPSADWDGESAALAWASVLAVAVIGGLSVSARLTNTVAALVNPEYWALIQILK